MWGSAGFRARTTRATWSKRSGPRAVRGGALLSVLSLVTATFAAQGLGLSPLGSATAASAASNTVVSIEFDDGYGSQYQTRAMLSAHGMHGTYYINSGTRPPEYGTLSWAQIHDLA